MLGVADGARTHDNRNHNPGLYQLSYSHRSADKYNRASDVKAAWGQREAAEAASAGCWPAGLISAL